MTKTDRNRKYDFRDVLAQNIQALMEHHPFLKSQSEVSRHCAIPQRTIGRILNGDTSANVSSIVGIAVAFGLEPWQLFVPNLNPKNLPRLSFLSEDQAKALQKLSQALSEIPGIEVLTSEQKKGELLT